MQHIRKWECWTFCGTNFWCWSVGSKSVKVQLSTDRKRSYDWLTTNERMWPARWADVRGEGRMTNLRTSVREAWSNNHTIDFENTTINDKGTFRTRKTLEAWHTWVTPNTDNSSSLLPGQYNILFFQTFIIIYILIISQFTLFYSNVRIAFLSFILPVEDCSLGSQKLVVFNQFSQRSFLNLN